MQYDCVATINFLPTCEGGRKTELNTLEYRVPITFSGIGFDARIYLAAEDIPVKPGNSICASIKFLSRDNAKQFLHVNQEFLVLEGKVVARGRIIKVNEIA